MDRDELQLQYENKSNIELLLIATNYDGGYVRDAVDTAFSVLLSRYKHTTNLEKIWNEEIGRLCELAEKCSVCQNPDVVYTEDFYLCSEARIDTIGSIPGIIALAAVGFGYAKEKYAAIKVEFRLCKQCLAQRTNTKKHGTEVSISWEEYNKHPLCSLYKPLGFTEIRTKI